MTPVRRREAETYEYGNGGDSFQGIVNLTGVCQTGQHEKASTQLSTSPVFF
jgi:hypothetical protein